MTAFEAPWRKAYEGYSILAWGACAIATVHATMFRGMPEGPFLYLMLVTLIFIAWNSRSAWDNLRRRIALGGKAIAFISDAALTKKVQESHQNFKELWLGWGFDWANIHTQRLYAIKRGDPKDFYAPFWMMYLKQWITKQAIGAITAGYIGAPWLHGLEADEQDIRVSVDAFIGNTLVVGAPRCGKTRLIEIIVAQAIKLGYTVILLDPKGDRELERSMESAAKSAGRASDYVKLHLGFPSEGIRIDLLKNFTNPSDLATRISSLMPGGDTSSSFRDFAWGVINAIVLGMLYMGEKPTLVRIRGYVENGIADLLLRVLLKFLDTKLTPAWEEEAQEYAMSMPTQKGKRAENNGEVQVQVRTSLGLLLAYYMNVIRQRGMREECIESLATIYRHDSAHYSKMIANLLPILAMLTTGDLASLLSPDSGDINDPRPITDNQALIRSEAIFYLGLDSLANKTVSSAVGAMYLSDMTSVAAAIFNYEPERGKEKKVFLVVDESVEVVNEPYITMLNKAAGAGFVNIAVCQTIADYAARFESMEKARQMLGNFNNLISLRVKDGMTQQFIVETFPESFISTKQTTYGTTSNTEKPVTEFTGNVNERVSETLTEQIPSHILGELGNWQYIGSVAGGRIIKGRVPIIDFGAAA